MPCVANGLYVVQGEVAILLAAMRRGSRWSSHSLQDSNQDVLVQSLTDLKEALNQLRDLKDLDPSHYFGPFLEVIRAGGTTGPITSIALSAVHKFLAHNLIDVESKNTPGTLDNIADAVTHTKFVSTDQNSDGVVLLKIVQVLRALVISPFGSLLTHESMCEIMLSCFRICFEHRLTEHIRKSAEFSLKDMVHHLFAKLPEFSEDVGASQGFRKIKMNKGIEELDAKDQSRGEELKNEKSSLKNIVDIQGEIHKEEKVGDESRQEFTQEINVKDSNAPEPSKAEEETGEESSMTAVASPTEYVNQQGVRFRAVDSGTDPDSGSRRYISYGISWIRELFRFLVSLCNPMDKMNSDTMVNVGLALVEVVLEVGADALSRFPTLLELVKDELCRNLFSLLQTDRLSIFALDIQVCFLLFESLRTHLKFQLENYLTRLIDMIISDSVKVTFEQREIALEGIVQLWRVPCLVTELYLNYDCDLYCSNLFEDITRLLSKNAIPATSIYSTHLLSLDALLTIIDTVEKHCHSRILNERHAVEASSVPASKVARHPVTQNIPSHEQLMAVKRKKKLLITGSEHFNMTPKKGIQFLQEHHLLKQPLDPQEVVYFLRENPRLEKKMIGDYISSRSNIEVLAAFVKSFDFVGLRIDEALRLFLETFRLPGESPLIAMIMEYFAEHWHKSNNEPFTNADAAFTLAYAVIMLNVDQHNHNVKRQNIPMSKEGFKKNLKSVNGGQDFDQQMLDEIYTAIKNDEIVMPAEQTGLIKENYLWKVLLRRGAGKGGLFIHAPEGLYDHDLFSMIWVPTNAALSVVFDKSADPAIYRKAISGFRKCAMISAHYGMSNDFDSLINSLSKFTLLTPSTDSGDQITIAFGANAKAQLATQTLFHLVHRHGDILREGWTTVLELINVLYKCRLLPSSLVEAEDFLEVGGKIQLYREEAPVQKTETGLLSSLYLFALGEGGRAPGPEEQEAMQNARDCIQDCRVESIVSESKFLRVDSLVELVKALIAVSPEPTARSNTNISVFFLELIVKIVMPNRERAETVWPLVRDHLYSVMMSGSACENHFLTERAIVGLLRLAIHLMRREDISGMVLQSLRMLLLLKPSTIQRVARQIAYGLNDLIKTSAANIHTTTDWTIIFTLLECVGAGSPPPRLVGDAADQGSAVPWAFASSPTRARPVQGEGTKSDGDLHSGGEDSGLGGERGYTSEPELGRDDSLKPTVGGWILVGPAGELQPLSPRGLKHFDMGVELFPHDPYALVKCCETLAFLVRDVAHITPFNYRAGVQCIRIFVEASLAGEKKKTGQKVDSLVSLKDGKTRKKIQKRRDGRSAQMSPTSAYDADESDEEDSPSGYHQVTIQLLDLMHTLHTRTAQIHRWWAEEGEARPDVGSLWQHGWCPLLQGISRLCCDSRKQVRMTAITYLQRALLVHDLQTLTADEWESCFTDVLFPLLAKLLELKVPPDEVHLEETRVRASTVLSKVFLHHLSPLLSLSSFTTLWMKILDLMDTYMHVDKSDLLTEAIPESLKNMLLVMDSAQVFGPPDAHLPLWDLTWNRISSFLPRLQEDFFKSQSLVPKREDVSEISAAEVSAQSDPPNRAASSIILQPPTVPHSYTTPIFNHIGQQMPTTVLAANPVPVAPTSNLQPEADCVLTIPSLACTNILSPEPSSPSMILPSSPKELLATTGPIAPRPRIVSEPVDQMLVCEGPILASSPPKFGSHPSAFVPYVSTHADTVQPENVQGSSGNSNDVEIALPSDCSNSPGLPESENKSESSRALFQESNSLSLDSFSSLPLYIPATTKPVQMFSGSRVVGSDPTLVATTALSQYFSAPDNQHDVFDDLAKT